jgi:methionyl aminopeptidase
VPGYRHTLCTSVNEEIVHGIPGARVLRDGDLLSVDCGAIVSGWHGDAAISVFVGGDAAARPEDLSLSRATEESLWAGIAAMQVGGRLYAVGEAIEESILARVRRTGVTTASSRTTSAMPSARRCTWTRRSPTTPCAARVRCWRRGSPARSSRW